MNSKKIPPRASLKLQARQAMIRHIRPCMAASGILLALHLAAFYFQAASGGVLGYYLLSAADYTTATGIFLAEGGLTAVLRLDAAGVLFALPLSFRQLGVFALVHGIVFLVTVPLLMGVLEQYHAFLQHQNRPLSSVFRWYLDLRLTGKAFALNLVLGLVKWGMRLMGAIPGLVLFIWATDSTNPGASIGSLLIPFAMLLLLAGGIAAYFVYTLILPAQYLLVRRPEASIRSLLSAGYRVFRGRRRDYFVFRLSFLLWHGLVNATYGAMGLFVHPYFELANLLYLQAVEPDRTEDLPAPP